MLLPQIVSILLGVAATAATEVGVPERYLRPRHYNPHPLQTLLAGSPPLRLPSHLLLDQPPYEYYPRTSVRQQDSSPVQFPAVPEPVKPTKSKTRCYITVPKNYAFAYAVKDRQSGDDFSHKQAHNGASTRGEYRVKLPDGRTQIVSYTADNNGYKADVRYDEEGHSSESVEEKIPVDSGNVYYSPGYGAVSNSILQEPDYPDQQEVIYKQPVQIVRQPNRVAQQYRKLQPTARPIQVLFSPSPQPYKVLAQPVQFRALPQTAEEYTSSDTPNYYIESSTPSPGYYAPPVSSTAATPIMEDQDDIPGPTKPSVISRYYAQTTPAPPAVRYVFIPHSTQYLYDDS